MVRATTGIDRTSEGGTRETDFVGPSRPWKKGFGFYSKWDEEASEAFELKRYIIKFTFNSITLLRIGYKVAREKLKKVGSKWQYCQEMKRVGPWCWQWKWYNLRYILKVKIRQFASEFNVNYERILVFFSTYWVCDVY